MFSRALYLGPVIENRGAIGIFFLRSDRKFDAENAWAKILVFAQLKN